MIFLYVPIFIPDAQTQTMFIDSIQKNCTLSFDSWSTDRKTVDIQLDHKFLLEVHETTAVLKI